MAASLLLPLMVRFLSVPKRFGRFRLT